MFRILKKYSRSGTRPLGSFCGKYFMNSLSSFVIGQSLITESSSKSGTFMKLTYFRSKSSFSSAKTSLRKSLFIMYSGGRYNCTEQVWSQSFESTYWFLWSNEWSLPWNWSGQRVLAACAAVFSCPRAVVATVVGRSTSAFESSYLILF